MRISDWSSDVCSSDLGDNPRLVGAQDIFHLHRLDHRERLPRLDMIARVDIEPHQQPRHRAEQEFGEIGRHLLDHRSEEHTSELQSLMRISYAVFCLKKKKKITQITHTPLYIYN